MGFKIFCRTAQGLSLTRRGMEFYEKRKNWLKLIFSNQYANPEEEKDEFSIAGQHYDSLPPTITAFQSAILIWKNFVFSNLQFKYLMKEAQGIVRLGLSTSTIKIKRIMQRLKSLGLEVIS